MKNRRGLVFVLIGVLLIVGAAALTVYNIWEDTKAANSAESVVEDLLPMIPEPQEVVVDPLNPSEVKIPDYILNPEMDMPVIQVNGRDYVGVVSIPSLELNLPVMNECTYRLLKVAPCRYSGTAYLNNMVIAAHNYRRHFGGLSRLQQGDAVNFTDADGNVFRYEVGEVEVLAPTEKQKVLESDWDLTLFTCTLGGRTRLTVRCMQIEQEQS